MPIYGHTIYGRWRSALYNKIYTVSCVFAFIMSSCAPKSTFNRDACGQYHWLRTDGSIVTAIYDAQLCQIECELPDGTLYYIRDVHKGGVVRALLTDGLLSSVAEDLVIINALADEESKYPIPVWIVESKMDVRIILHNGPPPALPKNPFFKNVYGDAVLFMKGDFVHRNPRFSSLHLVDGHNYCYE